MSDASNRLYCALERADDLYRTPLVLDEIPYAPELVASLKRRIDERLSPGQFILSGSQQWSVLTSVAESLVGRRPDGEGPG